MIELDQILDGLIRRTTDGKLQWRRSVRDDQFVASVDAISVVVGEWASFSSGFRPTYRLEILDENGQTVEVLDNDNSTGEQYEKMGQLFALARRSALNIDSVLQKLAESLEL